MSNMTHILAGDKSQAWWEHRCRDEECRAIRDLSCAADAYTGKIIPNTMGYLNKRYFEQAQMAYSRTLLSLGYRYPGRIPLYCKLLARVAATMTDDLDDNTRKWTAYFVTTFGLYLQRPENHCLADIVAATPKSASPRPNIDDWAIPCLDKLAQCRADARAMLQYPPP